MKRGVLVTGGSRGIGRAIVQRFTDAGDDVAFSYATDQAGADATRVICPTAKGIPLDLREPGAAQRLVAAAVERVGTVAVLVNCAGIYPHAPILETTPALREEIFRVNFAAAFELMQAVALNMRDRGGGAIVNVTSINAFAPDSGLAAYDASKAALTQATRTAALELGPLGIRVNAVAPGLVDDPALATAAPARRSAFLAHAPLQRLVAPEDVAECVHFLASTATRAVTGVTLIVDAGVTLAGYTA